MTAKRPGGKLIQINDSDGLMSFNNLIEGHVLRALRVDHGVRMGAIRTAIRYAEKELGIRRLLLDKRLETDGVDLFLDRLGKLINLSLSGQLAVRRLLAGYLRRIDHDGGQHPVRFYPFVARALNESRSIVIDPRVSFGRPSVVGTGISTSVIAGRIDAGETVEEVADDYGLRVLDIEEAVVYERAA